MKDLNDLEIGKAGEHLVCADLILNGYSCVLTGQGLKYDILLEANYKLYKIQVKTTRGERIPYTSDSKTPVYIFSIGRNGKKNCNSFYEENDVDIFALVSLEEKYIAYIPYTKVSSNLLFRNPKRRFEYSGGTGRFINEFPIDKIINPLNLNTEIILKDANK